MPRPKPRPTVTERRTTAAAAAGPCADAPMAAPAAGTALQPRAGDRPRSVATAPALPTCTLRATDMAAGAAAAAPRPSQTGRRRGEARNSLCSASATPASTEPGTAAASTGCGSASGCAMTEAALITLRRSSASSRKPPWPSCGLYSTRGCGADAPSSAARLAWRSGRGRDVSSVRVLQGGLRLLHTRSC
jgi:hypothetical protein